MDYYFLSKDEFAAMIDNDQLLEYAIVYDDYKGIPKSEVEQALESGKDVVMRVDVQGAATVRKTHPEAIQVFLTTESEEELANRLKARKSESTEGLNLRIATARKEMKRIVEFDYVVVNRDGKLDEAADSILAIIRSEHLKIRDLEESLEI